MYLFTARSMSPFIMTPRPLSTKSGSKRGSNSHSHIIKGRTLRLWTARSGISLLPLYMFFYLMLQVLGFTSGQGQTHPQQSTSDPLEDDPAQVNPCPSLFTEVPEDTPVGTVLFSFESDAIQIRLDTSRDPRYQGYLGLRPTSYRRYQIVLNKGLDLNVLNPRNPPVPSTNEQLNCQQPSPQRMDTPLTTKAIAVILQCDVSYSSTTVQVTSDVRVAISDINDNKPYFLCAPYYKQISESTQIYTTVFSLRGLAADPDIEGGIAGYNLQSDGGGVFGMTGASSDGSIILQRQVDYDSGPRLFVLNVTTTDIGDPPRSNWTQLFVTITDGDDQNPTFSHDIYHLTLPEQNASLVYQPIKTHPPIHAFDLDYGINASVSYQLDGGQVIEGQSYFSINTNTGEIIPQQVLDRTRISQFVIRIKAYQNDNPQYRNSYATLVVTVEDANVHAPNMERLLYNVSLPEHSPNGYRVQQITATDGDMIKITIEPNMTSEGTNAHIEYFLLDPLKTGAFEIEAATGIIYVSDTDKLDKERTDYFFLQVYAQETSTVERYTSDTANVYVWLTDTNDNSPVFRPASTYTFLVNTSAEPTTSVGQVLAEDSDEGEFGHVRYKLLFGTHGAADYFGLDPDTGSLFVRKSLRRVDVRTFIITIQAEDQARSLELRRTAVAMVNITTISGNDHPPVFIDAPYSVSLGEASSYGTTVVQLKTEDEDGSPIEYSIVSGDPLNQFLLHSRSGVLSVWRPLDREDRTSYSLSVSAWDGQHVVETVVFIDVEDANDNSPVFEQPSYMFYVRENQPAGQDIGTVKATDGDAGNNARIQYALGGSWSNQYFSIDAGTGTIYNAAALDREVTPRYQLTVVAQDNGFPHQNTIVVVDVIVTDLNDHAPRFERLAYDVTIAENSPPSPIIQLTATDRDEGASSVIYYNLLQGDKDLFAVDAINGIVYSVREIDLRQQTQQNPQEVRTQHHLVVEAYNQRPYDVTTLRNASVSIVVHVEDVNDNVPVFAMSSYSAAVYENEAVGSSLLRVMASDADLRTWNRGSTFWLGGEPGAYKFMVERSTGVVRLVRPLDTDTPERDRSFTFTVYASDMMPTHGNGEIRNVSTQVNITVLDVNDNAPQFTKEVYGVRVREDVPTGGVIIDTLHAVDIDRPPHNQVTYDLITYNVPFEISRKTGQLSVKGSLDYDLGRRHYQLLVIGIDNGQPARTGSATVEVTVDNVNDNMPRFEMSTTELNVMENLPANSYVGQVSASDADGDLVYYALSGGETDYFHVNSTSGQIFTKRPIDYETTGRFTLTALAADWLIRGDVTPGRDHVTSTRLVINVVDQNDNAPVFSKSWYRAAAKEGASNLTILQLEAQDADSGRDGSVTYHLLLGDTQPGIFHLDETTGRLWVIRGDLLDHLKAADYRLIVQAKDGGIPPHSTTAEVLVIVDATNSHSPEFSLANYESHVRENQPAGTLVTQVTATDPDPVGSITYHLITTSTDFTIDSLTGRIVTARALDWERTPTKTLRVSAHDGINYGYANVSVTIDDLNDNTPRFTQGRYTRFISQNTAVGRTVLTVTATDADDSYNGHVTYWLTGTEGKFAIKSDSGDIIVTDKLDMGDAKTTYNMRVYCRDHGIPARTTVADVTIYVNDSNQHAPEFTEHVYEVSVPENTPVNTTILTMTATDSDEGAAGQVELSVVSGNPGLNFELLQNGELRIRKLLDYELSAFYQLHVRARDKADNPQSTVMVVHVRVTDINDNVPQILPLPERIRHFGTVTQGSELIQVYAIDKDGDDDGNNDIVFGLPEQSRFQINPQTGQIFTTTDLSVGAYQVTVQAKDRGTPALYSLKSLTIEVLNPELGRFFPTFAKPLYKVSVEEASATPLSVINLEATVPGRRPDEGVTYTLSAGNENGYFQIGSTTGEIRLVSPLRWATQKIHTLVITATNKESPANSRAAVVAVEVKNKDDESPFFPFTIFTAPISEDALPGTTVKVISALDNDRNKQIWYGVTNRNDDGAFKVETVENKAVVIVQKPLDRDSMPPANNDVYILEIGASDGVHYSFPATMRVVVLDVNDNFPAFNATSYTASISESAGGCQEVLRVHATDLDSSDDDKLVYSTTAGASDLFTVDPVTGMITVRCDNTPVNLDREYQAVYTLTVAATDTVGRRVTAQVNINVQDDNDNTPKFIGEPYTATVVEGPGSRSLVTYVSVTDADDGDNAVVTFRLRPEDDEFVIYTQPLQDYTKGEIRVVKQLDREKLGLEIVNGTALYPLRVYAMDRGNPAQTSTATVTIYISDINDNIPVFVDPLYKVTISEGTPPGTPVTTITANDPDSTSQLRYTIVQDSPFRIDERTGGVTVDRELNAAQRAQYKLAVMVTDGRFTATAPLEIQLIDMNNHSPQFSEPAYYFRVTENDLTGLLGQVVGQVVATDLDAGDNGRVTYHLTSRNAEGRFRIEEPEVGQIVTAGQLDRESSPQFTIIVTASDMGVPPRMSTCEVEIELDDDNDNAPHFIDAPYTGEVMEHAATGATVFVIMGDIKFPTIKAEDRDEGFNAEMKFRLEGPYAEWFDIHPSTAAITLNAQGSEQLDRETTPTLILQVVAMDRNGSTGSLSNKTQLVVNVGDMNDNYPTFVRSFYQFSVYETAWPNTEVGRVEATDADAAPNNRLTYSIRSGGDGRFYVDRLSGVISVAGGLDRETRSSYMLTVLAADAGITPGSLEGATLVNVTVMDVNDNVPTFTRPEYVFSITENDAQNVYVGVVVANDIDDSENGRVTYSLLTPDVPFEVDPVTGWMKVRSAPLDREERAQYDLAVSAADSGDPRQEATANVRINVIDVNDNQPTFDRDTYMVNLLEKTPVGAVLLYTKATDPDSGVNGHVTYSLLARGNAARILTYFEIGPNSGLLTLARPLLRAQLEAEGVVSAQNGTVEMLVRATDGGTDNADTATRNARYGEARIIVNVDEINTESPQFTRVSYMVNLQEETPADMLVLSVEAISSSATTQISYSVMHTDLFKIKDPLKGEVVTTGRRLDREEQSSHSFTIKAVDNRVPQGSAYTAVLVRLTDINDNPPQFERSLYTYTLGEGDYTQNPLTLAFIEASDVDESSGQNGQIRYTLTSDKEELPFTIEGSTGQLMVTGVVDREECPLYRLHVHATDSGADPLTSRAEVHVTIRDLNDNYPVFDGAPYTATIDSLVHAGKELVAVAAHDLDEGMNGTIVYEIIPQQDEPTPFYIQTRGGTGVLYVLGGRDVNPDDARVYDVIVMASDLGMPPKTATAHVYVNVTGRTSGVPFFNEPIYEVQLLSNTAVGKTIFVASAGRGDFYYSIIGGDADGTFSIREEHGAVVLMKRLSLQRTSYELTIQSHDNTVPKSIATAKLRIYVVRSGPVPVFDEQRYTATVRENSPPPQLLVDLDTADERASRAVSYYILDGDMDGTFYMENTTGRLWCTRQLDREQRANYTIRVGAERLNEDGTVIRRRRDLHLQPNEAEVVVKVGDENDNPPRFVDDPIIVGMPADAPLNYLVTSLQVEDADAGDNGRVVITSPDITSFYVSPEGHVRTRRIFTSDDAMAFNLTVTATDGAGSGTAVTTIVKIFRLTNGKRAILIASIPQSEFQARQKDLVDDLSAILGWRVYIEKLEPHISDDKTVDLSKTDMFFYAVDVGQGRVVSRGDVLTRVTEKSREIEELFKEYAVAEVKPVSLSSTQHAISHAEIALIVIAVLIFFGAIIGACLVCISASKAKKAIDNPTKRLGVGSLYANHLGGRKKSDFKLTNPLYADSEAYSDPLELDNLSVVYSTPARRQRETQKVSVYLPPEAEELDHPDSTSNSTSQTEFVSFDDDGKAIIVVDKMASSSKSARVDGGVTEADSTGWVSPYGGDTYARHMRVMQPYLSEARSAVRRSYQHCRSVSNNSQDSAHSTTTTNSNASRLSVLRDKLRCVNPFRWRNAARVRHSDLVRRIYDRSGVSDAGGPAEDEARVPLEARAEAVGRTESMNSGGSDGSRGSFRKGGPRPVISSPTLIPRTPLSRLADAGQITLDNNNSQQPSVTTLSNGKIMGNGSVYANTNGNVYANGKINGNGKRTSAGSASSPRSAVNGQVQKGHLFTKNNRNINTTKPTTIPNGNIGNNSSVDSVGVITNVLTARNDLLIYGPSTSGVQSADGAPGGSARYHHRQQQHTRPYTISSTDIESSVDTSNHHHMANNAPSGNNRSFMGNNNNSVQYATIHRTNSLRKSANSGLSRSNSAAGLIQPGLRRSNSGGHSRPTSGGSMGRTNNNRHHVGNSSHVPIVSTQDKANCAVRYEIDGDPDNWRPSPSRDSPRVSVSAASRRSIHEIVRDSRDVDGLAGSVRGSPRTHAHFEAGSLPGSVEGSQDESGGSSGPVSARSLSSNVSTSGSVKTDQTVTPSVIMLNSSLDNNNHRNVHGLQPEVRNDSHPPGVAVGNNYSSHLLGSAHNSPARKPLNSHVIAEKPGGGKHTNNTRKPDAPRPRNGILKNSPLHTSSFRIKREGTFDCSSFKSEKNAQNTSTSALPRAIDTSEAAEVLQNGEESGCKNTLRSQMKKKPLHSRLASIRAAESGLTHSAASTPPLKIKSPYEQTSTYF